MTKKGPTPKRPRIRLTVIPEEQAVGRSVIAYQGEGTVAMKGQFTRLIMECGACGAPIVEGVMLEQLENLVFRCNGCGAYNQTLN